MHKCPYSPGNAATCLHYANNDQSSDRSSERILCAKFHAPCAVIEGSTLQYTGDRPATAPAVPFGSATADRAAAREQRRVTGSGSAATPSVPAPSRTASPPCATTACHVLSAPALAAPNSHAQTAPIDVHARPTTQTGERITPAGDAPPVTCVLAVHESYRGQGVSNPTVATVSAPPSPCAAWAAQARAEPGPQPSAQRCRTRQCQPRSLLYCKSDTGLRKPFGPVSTGRAATERNQCHSCCNETPHVKQALEADQQSLVPCCGDRRSGANGSTKPRRMTSSRGGHKPVWPVVGGEETAPSKSRTHAGPPHEKLLSTDPRGRPWNRRIFATVSNRSTEGGASMPDTFLSSGTFPNCVKEGSAPPWPAPWHSDGGAGESPADAGGENGRPESTPLPGSWKDETRMSRLLRAGQKLRRLQRAPCDGSSTQRAGAPQPSAEGETHPSDVPAPDQWLAPDFSTLVLDPGMSGRSPEHDPPGGTAPHAAERREGHASPFLGCGRVPMADGGSHPESAPVRAPLNAPFPTTALPMDEPFPTTVTPLDGPFPTTAGDGCGQQRAAPAEVRFLGRNRATTGRGSGVAWPCGPTVPQGAAPAGKQAAGGRGPRPNQAMLAHVRAAGWDHPWGVLATESRLLMDWAGMGGDWLSDHLLPAAQALFQSQGVTPACRSLSH